MLSSLNVLKNNGDDELAGEDRGLYVRALRMLWLLLLLKVLVLLLFME